MNNYSARELVIHKGKNFGWNLTGWTSCASTPLITTQWSQRSQLTYLLDSCRNSMRNLTRAMPYCTWFVKFNRFIYIYGDLFKIEEKICLMYNNFEYPEKKKQWTSTAAQLNCLNKLLVEAFTKAKYFTSNYITSRISSH